MSTPTVLVLPYPAQGHVNPMMTLSQMLVEHGCRIIFVNTDFDHKRVVMSSTAEEQQQQDHDQEPLLKLVSIPDGLGHDDDRNNLSKLCDSLLNTMPTMLEKLIIEEEGIGDSRISLIIADVCMAWALDVGTKLGIRGALLCPSSAAFFALLYNVPKLTDDGIIDSDGGLLLTTKKKIQITQGISEMDPREFFWLNMGDTINGKIVLNYLMQCSQRWNLTEWWLCNTTHELEHGPLSSIPNIVPIGPLLRSYDDDDTIATTKTIGQYWKEDFSCMSWLDQQPHGSVLYVAFGSFTHFNQNQFNELALGLDLTNRPFLWVVREDNKIAYPHEFQGHKGKIVGWSPQQKVLNHPAIACFVTHCGWNSTIEGVSKGLPLLCWAYFGDQVGNKTYIVDELKVGLGFELDQNGLVTRVEFKRKVDQILNDEDLKSRALELKDKVMNNIAEGGKSLKNLNRFVKWLKE